MATLLNQLQLAQALGVSVSTVVRLRKQGLIPEPVRISPRRPKWHSDVIAEILEAASNR
jgi:predicted DNA-binding transcriptional regulator AlpA